jgi:predicted RNA-binding protein associated with RNAse of E/G family
VGPAKFEPGTITYAYYRKGAGYVLWRMYGPDGRLRGHLFHICKDLEIGEDRVEYLDLLLDLWVDENGRVTVLDRDEVEECRSKGIIGERDLARISLQEKEINENFLRIISQLDLP